MFYISSRDYTPFGKPSRVFNYKAAVKRVQIFIRPLRLEIKELKRELKIMQKVFQKNFGEVPNTFLACEEKIKQYETELKNIRVSSFLEKECVKKI